MVATPHGQKRPYINWEVGAALALDRDVIVCLAKGLPPDDLVIPGRTSERIAITLAEYSDLKHLLSNLAERLQPQIPLPDDGLVELFVKEFQAIETAYHSAHLIGERWDLPSNEIIFKVHGRYTLHDDNQTLDALSEYKRKLTEQRKQQNKGSPAYLYSDLVYRLTREPQHNKKGDVELDVLPIRFSYKALLAATDDDVPPETKKNLWRKIDRCAAQLSEKLRYERPEYPELNSKNYIPLGTEITIITSDEEYILLRKRGLDVVDGKKTWDTSVSGYVREGHIRDGRLYVGETAAQEVERELGLPNVNALEKTRWTGLHYNGSDSLDVLGYLKVPMTAEQLGRWMVSHAFKKAPDYPGTCRMFEIKRQEVRAEEVFVWDYKNMIVPFDGPSITECLEQYKEAYPDQTSTIIPEALASIVRALEIFGKSTKGLPLPDWAETP